MVISKRIQETYLISELKTRILEETYLISELKTRILEETYLISELKTRILEETYLISELRNQSIQEPYLVPFTLENIVQEPYLITFDLYKSTHESYLITFDLYKSTHESYFITFGLYTSTTEPYSTAGLRTTIVQRYEDVPTVRTLAVEFYNDGIFLNKRIKEPYNNASNPSKIIQELYHDPKINTGTYFELYNDQKIITNRVKEPYKDPTRTQTQVQELYTIRYSTVRSIQELYSITEQAINKTFVETYNIEENNLIQKSIQENYYVIDGSSVVLIPSASVRTDNKDINFLGVDIKAGLSSYCISCNVDLASIDDYINCKYNQDVVITINTEQFLFFIESKSRSFDNNSTQYSIDLLSPVAKLDSPYSKPITETFPDGINSKVLVQQLANTQGINVDYQILDYHLESHVISITNETPLSAIRRVVNAIGGIVQSKPNGDMLVIYKYPISPKDFDTAIPNKIFTTEKDIHNFSEALDIREGFNAFTVTDRGTSEVGITLEEKDIDSTTKEIRGYRVPFDDGPFELETSGGGIVSIETHSTLFEITIPEDPEDPEDEYEIVEFIDFVARTSKPIYEVIDFDYIEDDLGAFQISEDGTLTIIDQTIQNSESLLKIKYKTKFYKFTVRISTQTDNPVQFYVPEIEG